ncbi:TPA: tail fiber assembly protein [Salmonella enterica subsp. enterica serovar Infantis]|nr:tail fiber assembly protein [Salmonella enterica subsp. enterica serovar Infantis]HCJ0429091.1 tail fiber assembly protein [Salmonella enterica subsp. enterica serovar Infantis]
MTGYCYSAKSNAFYYAGFQSDYEQNGSWPDDAVDVDDSVYIEFAANEPPVGKMRVAGSDGLPAWVDIPAPTSEQILENNIKTRNRLMQACSVASYPLQSALAKGVITEAQQTVLSEIEDYSINLLNNVDWTASPLQLPPAPAAITAVTL